MRSAIGLVCLLCLASCGGSSPSSAGKNSVSGTVSGVATAGVTLTLSGAAARSTVTGPAGNYSFAALPDGQYMLTPSSGNLTFSPPAFTFAFPVSYVCADYGAPAGCSFPPDKLDRFFIAGPHSLPMTVTVTGDAESGVPTATYTHEVVPLEGPFQGVTECNPDVMIYHPNTDRSSFSFPMYNAKDPGLGGYLDFGGAPQPGMYTNATANSPKLRSMWAGSNFTLVIDSATEVPTSYGIPFYSVHGTFHLDCPPTPNDANFTNTARGNVMLDIRF